MSILLIFLLPDLNVPIVLLEINKLIILYFQSRDSSGIDLDGSLRRSHSQSHVNKPSQDLLGLSLHPIDPIDEPKTSQEESASANQSVMDNSQGLDTSTSSNFANKGKMSIRFDIQYYNFIKNHVCRKRN